MLALKEGRIFTSSFKIMTHFYGQNKLKISSILIITLQKLKNLSNDLGKIACHDKNTR
jgi:hypothetical protein